MSVRDAELLAIARELLERVYRPRQHEVVCALRVADGAVVTGVHVEGSAGRSSVCAEGVAMGNAVIHAAQTGSPLRIEAVVSVLRRPGTAQTPGTEHIIEPCGVCAELITDYTVTARVWVADAASFAAVPAAGLLPAKRARERSAPRPPAAAEFPGEDA